VCERGVWDCERGNVSLEVKKDRGIQKTHLETTPRSAPPRRLSRRRARTSSRMPPKFLPQLLLLPLPVLPHPPIQISVEIAGGCPAVLLDGRDDGLFVGMTKVAFYIGVAEGDEGLESALEEVGLGEGVDVGREEVGVDTGGGEEVGTVDSRRRVGRRRNNGGGRSEK
jgi:hypothetical protein